MSTIPQYDRRNTGAGSAAFDPLFAVFGELFFPDWHAVLDFLNYVAASLERFGPVRRDRDDGDAYFADLQPANPMLHGGADFRPLLHNVPENAVELFLRHLRIDVILEEANSF